ncbi:NAD(P)H-dependent oxidoreductase [uncultured Caulobacter sp.]|uniref:NAD(P)H-dependent oxidoreductase n=1 Tax=uncultured Caulobacter sp. TaxID=158749 RepID=UPI0026058FC8|nr:NAD(P)H-dependent oxidoreductase [uncultured Caulobacter sp.]
MKIALVLAHPSETSFCRALADACAEALSAAGAEVLLRDLYALDFDPRLPREELPTASGSVARADVVEERALLADVDGFLLVYPFWFNAPPAMLKGYVDRVLSGGFGFQPTAHGADPLLVGRTLASVTTSGAPDAWVESTGVLNTLIKSFDLHICNMTGLRFAGHDHIGGVGPEVSETFVADRLAQARTFVARALLEDADSD